MAFLFSRLYWTDRADNKVYSVYLNGSNKRDVVEEPYPGQQMYGVTMFKVGWSSCLISSKQDVRNFVSWMHLNVSKCS